ncbi:phosphatase PAP2 family protein [Neobacillus sp. YIM B06451]|uniref:phosphatase PAP2 family protein n=1 Tax=Neobacillus sp. YIM B06451 TaxID=3070994 RepID=UPI00292D451A|nr:phosphatase PAP2 family protein [Neobacillus sp. YIM B06451]
MIAKLVHHLYQFECNIYSMINNRYDQKGLNLFFHQITHLGGATATISFTVFFILCFDFPTKLWGLESALSLLTSHLFVFSTKKIYPRARPYLSLPNARVGKNPLKDHSFPSGHTTAIFSIITPFIFHLPILGLILFPLACCVGVSRVFLGLHYPSDVLAGALVGMGFGLLAINII